MGTLYAENGKIYSHDYFEIYIPKIYFDAGTAENHGPTISTLGIAYARAFKGDQPQELYLFDVPVYTELNVYNTRYYTLEADFLEHPLETLCLEYMPNTPIMHQSLPKGREVANAFLVSVLGGKLPSTLNYADTMDIWWDNLEISGISYKVPSSIFEMILASTYRNPYNEKMRYGQLYGKQDNPSGYDYVTGNVREVVKHLSTFSGMVFEDAGSMISNGILNSEKNIDEPVSPLEKIIHY